MMFAECGIEIYETIGNVWVKEEGSGQNIEVTSSVIQVRESVEQLQQ